MRVARGLHEDCVCLTGLLHWGGVGGYCENLGSAEEVSACPWSLALESRA